MAQQGSAVLTESAARRCFGDQDPIGQRLHVDAYNSDREFIVTGVVADWPSTSSLRFELLTSTPSPSVEDRYWNAWLPRSSYLPFETYIEIRDGTDITELSHRIQSTMVSNMGEEVASKNTYYLQALSRMHLYSDQDFRIRSHLSQDAGWPAFGDIEQVTMLILLAGVLLVIACANFVNMSSSRSVTRAKEVGVRKILGAGQNHLAGQFLGEAILLVLISALIALGVVGLILPTFNAFVGTSLTLDSINSVTHWVWGGPVVLIISLLAGGIPAFYLASFNPLSLNNSQIHS